jgi:beta-lactamase regulating signal transducer with metallopeptidase domain
MNTLFAFAVHNTAAAFVCALLVYAVTRRWRNPPVAHALWLLVLLRLVAPPILSINWPIPWRPPSQAARLMQAVNPAIADVPRSTAQPAEGQPRFANRPAARTFAAEPAASVKEPDSADSLRSRFSGGPRVLFCSWLGGAALCALVAVTRVVRFERRLRDTPRASERLQKLALDTATRLGVRHVPDIRYAVDLEIPLLWCAGRRPTIVLPKRLVRDLDEQSAALILAHELAHLRRRDHWVRVVELIVTFAYWWNPLVWVVRRQIHEAEELCCDAWVRWAFPDCAARYAEVVLQIAESLCGSQVDTRLLLASPLLRSLTLKARIEMLLERRFLPRVSRRSLFVMGLLALVVLPLSVQTTKTQAAADSKEESSATPPGTANPPTTPEFPYAVKFEQGATRFANGDKITILEVRGTSDRFTQGNIYWIRGTYTLASRDRAILLASSTVDYWILSGDLDGARSDYFVPGSADTSYRKGADPSYASGAELRVQRAEVVRGTGTFTLFLPMKHHALPHISFCSAERLGESLGGNYFGTGESVLKKWWRSADSDGKTTQAASPLEILDGGRVMSLQFRNAPWSLVLTKFAQATGLELRMQAMPAGTFNRSDSSRYTPTQTLAVMNTELAKTGWRAKVVGTSLCVEPVREDRAP